MTATLPQPVPLVLDPDSTLLRSDLFSEADRAFVHSQPLQCLKPADWLIKSKRGLLIEHFGEQGFDCMASSGGDTAVALRQPMQMFSKPWNPNEHAA